MTIYAAGIEADSFGFAVGSTYTVSGTSNHRDTTYTTSAIGANTGGPTYQFDFGTSLAALWFHGYFYMQGSLTITATGEILRFDSGTGPEFRLVGTGANGLSGSYVEVKFQKTTNGSTWTDVGAAFNIVSSAGYHMDLKLTLGGSGAFACWLNGSKVIDFTGDVSTQTNTTTFARLGNHTSGTLCYWSQVIVADVPTIGMRLQTLGPNAAGTYTEWTGAYTTIDESITYDETDSINSNTVNQRHTWNIVNTTASLIGNNAIRALCQSLRGQVASGSTPTNLQFMIRTASTDYTSPNLGFAADSVKRSAHRVVELNPNTGVAWTSANIDAVEVGVKAV